MLAAECGGVYHGVPPRLLPGARVGDIVTDDAHLTEAEAATQREAVRQREEAQGNRRATLRALRDGSGNLTAAQLTAVLRVLVREVLGDE